jgi:hypothetical protein
VCAIFRHHVIPIFRSTIEEGGRGLTRNEPIRSFLLTAHASILVFEARSSHETPTCVLATEGEWSISRLVSVRKYLHV